VVIILRITATIATFGNLPATLRRSWKALKDRIPIARAHRRHVEHLADVGPPAPDATPSLERAALEGAVGGVRMGGSARQIHEPGNAPLSDDPIVKLPAVAT
jgi:hypothetical protein